MSQIPPVFQRLFDGDHGGSGKARRCQLDGRPPGHRPPSGAFFQHGGVINASYHLTARPMILGDAHRVACLLSVQRPAPRPRRCHHGRTPADRGMVIRHRAMLRKGHSAPNLIAQHEGGQKSLPADLIALRQPKQSCDKRGPYMALGRVEPAMVIQRVNGSCLLPKRPRRAKLADRQTSCARCRQNSQRHDPG